MPHSLAEAQDAAIDGGALVEKHWKDVKCESMLPSSGREGVLQGWPMGKVKSGPMADFGRMFVHLSPQSYLIKGQ